MDKKLKYLLGFILVCVLGFIVLVLTTTFRSSLQYYVTVSELYASEGKYGNNTMKVAGVAAAIVKTEEAGRSTYRFNVLEGGKNLPVTFVGLVPDTFKEGSQVVVTGHLEANGQFTATDILAKCASKYDAKMQKTSM